MKCRVEGCESPAKHRMLCSKHYKRWWRHGDVNHCETIQHVGQKCANPFCDKQATLGLYCHACYQRVRKKGTYDYSVAPPGTGEPVTAAGYVLLNVNGRRIYKHRKVMEEHLGRKLLSTEVVHHIDGDPLNNKLENLELFDSQSAHMKHHFGR